MQIAKCFLYIILIGWIQASAKSDEIALSDLEKNSHGKILFIRHALAPGTGDPQNFKIGDCLTQRNLNKQGRKEAVLIGRSLRLSGIKISKIFSSEWCRCIETADLFELGPVETFSGLNSFYNARDKEKIILTKLRRLIKTFKPNQNLVIMVTHFVNIAAITKMSTNSGEGVILSLDNRHVQKLKNIF